MILAIDDAIPESNPQKFTKRKVRENRVWQAIERDGSFVRAEAHVWHYPNPVGHPPFQTRTQARRPLVPTAPIVARQFCRNQPYNAFAIYARKQADGIEFIGKL